jgi:hypothetical protein
MAAIHICPGPNTTKCAAASMQRHLRVCRPLLNGSAASKAPGVTSQHPCRWQHAPAVTQMQGMASPQQLSVVMHTCALCCRCQDCSSWHLQPALAGSKPMCTHTLPNPVCPLQGSGNLTLEG